MSVKFDSGRNANIDCIEIVSWCPFILLHVDVTLTSKPGPRKLCRGETVNPAVAASNPVSSKILVSTKEFRIEYKEQNLSTSLIMCRMSNSS